MVSPQFGSSWRLEAKETPGPGQRHQTKVRCRCPCMQGCRVLDKVLAFLISPPLLWNHLQLVLVMACAGGELGS